MQPLYHIRTHCFGDNTTGTMMEHELLSEYVSGGESWERDGEVRQSR